MTAYPPVGGVILYDAVNLPVTVGTLATIAVASSAMLGPSVTAQFAARFAVSFAF